MAWTKKNDHFEKGKFGPVGSIIHSNCMIAGNLKLNLLKRTPTPPPDTRDEFLSMTPKERQWLATIQIHQLAEVASTDYYFKQYMAKKHPGIHVADIGVYLKEMKMSKQECPSPERGISCNGKQADSENSILQRSECVSPVPNIDNLDTVKILEERVKSPSPEEILSSLTNIKRLNEVGNMADNVQDTADAHRNTDEETKDKAQQLVNTDGDVEKEDRTMIPELVISGLEDMKAPMDPEKNELHSEVSSPEALTKLSEYASADPVSNCLGKIPIFTVAHARQVLEDNLVTRPAGKCNPLLTIEHYYDLLLQLADETEPHKREALICKLLRVQDVAHVMNINKGQQLYLRLYNMLSDHFLFWQVIFQSLPQFFMLNKSTRPLNGFLSLFRSWLMGNTHLAYVVVLATSISNILSFLIADKFGMSVLSLLVTCSSNVKVFLNSAEEDRKCWASFLSKLIQSIDHHPHVENPLVGSRKHLVQILNAIAPSHVHLRYY